MFIFCFLAWYINGLLIPEINVVRGKTYTFVIEGGYELVFVYKNQYSTKYLFTFFVYIFCLLICLQFTEMIQILQQHTIHFTSQMTKKGVINTKSQSKDGESEYLPA